MDANGFQHDKTRTFYTVNPQKATEGSTSASITVKISHTHQRRFYVRTDDGDFHVDQQDQERFRGFKPFTIDSSLFTLQDASLGSRICQALAATMVRSEMQEAIMKEIIAQGIKMVKGFGGVGRMIVVEVVTLQNFVCFEGVGEC